MIEKNSSINIVLQNTRVDDDQVWWWTLSKKCREDLKKKKQTNKQQCRINKRKKIVLVCMYGKHV